MSVFRLEINTEAIEDWNYIDFVEVIGTRNIQSNVLERQVAPGGGGGEGGGSVDGLGSIMNKTYVVVYVPFKDAYGEDSFAYQGSDCFGDMFRSSSEGVVSFSIAAVNDVPELLLTTVDLVTGTRGEIKLASIVSDVETPFSKLALTITALPASPSAEISDGNTRISAAALPHRMAAASLYLLFPDDAGLNAAPDDVNDGVVQRLATSEVRFTATDEEGATVSGVLRLRVLQPQLECVSPGSAVEYSLGRIPMCVPCPQGTFALNSRKCVSCGERATTLASGAANGLDCVCREGFFRPDRLTPAGLCEVCPPLAFCRLDAVVETLELRPGVWRLSNSSTKLIECTGRPTDCSCAGTNFGVAQELEYAEPWGPNSYGSSCAETWDAPEETCVGRNTSEKGMQWCSERWCYVSSANCPGAKTTDVFADSEYADKLWYSYEQCGGVDHYEVNATVSFSSQCTGGADAGVDGASYCQSGSHGPKCEVCLSPDEYFDRNSASCISCPSGGHAFARAMLTLAVCLATVGLLYACAFAIKRRPHVYKMLSVRLKMVLSTAKALHLLPKLKIVVAFFQVVVSVPTVYSVDMPVFYTNWMRAFAWIDIDPISVFIPPQCLTRGGGYQVTLLRRALLPFAIAAAWFLLQLLIELYLRIRGVSEQTFEPHHVSSMIDRLMALRIQKACYAWAERSKQLHVASGLADTQLIGSTADPAVPALSPTRRRRSSQLKGSAADPAVSALSPARRRRSFQRKGLACPEAAVPSLALPDSPPPSPPSMVNTELEKVTQRLGRNDRLLLSRCMVDFSIPTALSVAHQLLEKKRSAEERQRKRRGGDDHPDGRMSIVREAARRAAPLSLFISFCFFPSVSSAVFRSWSCIEYEDASDSNTVARAFLRADLAVECGTKAHSAVTDIAWAFFAVWPLGCPLLYLALLLSLRPLLLERRLSDFSRATAFLHRECAVVYPRPARVLNAHQWLPSLAGTASKCVCGSRLTSSAN